MKPDRPEDHPEQCRPVESPERNWRYPPSGYRHHRNLAGGDDDDEEVAEPDAKRARTFALTFNVLKNAGVNDVDARNYCNAILGDAPESTFVELYGRGAIVNEANGPRRNLGLKGLPAFDMRTMKPGGGN